MADLITEQLAPPIIDKIHPPHQTAKQVEPVETTIDLQSQGSFVWRAAIQGSRRIMLAVFLTYIIIWFISQFSVSTLKPLYFDPALKTWVHYPGTVHHEWREGIARTAFGRHGIAGIPDIEAVAGPKVIFWGDSQVEAVQIDDQDKMAQQFTRLWKERHEDSLTGVGVGQAFFCAADYYYLIPRYEKVIKPVQAHFIVLPTIDDVLPGEVSPNNASFVDTPTLHFVPAPPPAINESLIHWMYELRLQFIPRTRSNLQDKVSAVRFAPGPVHHAQKAKAGDTRNTSNLDAAWDYLLTAMKGQTRQPIVFIYAPTVPRVEHNQLRETEANAPLAARFEQKCREHGVGFINMTSDFVRFHRETRQFPRGFNNSHPWEGHLNRNGHRLIAERILAYLEESQHAVHAN